MNPTLRRGIPWAVSLVLHAALLLIPARMGMLTRARPEERRIDLVFDQPAPRSSSPASRLPGRDEVGLPAGAAPSIPRSPAAPPLPSPSEEHAAPLADRLVDLAAPGSTALPTARDVLADLPAPRPASESAAFTAPAAPAEGEVSLAQPTVVWQGRAPGVIRRVNPEFPRVFSRTGQEGECVARISVTPAGTVSRVEIVHSSGYPEIDASVAAALRSWLFAKSDGQSVTAEISYPLRLRVRD